MEPKKKSNVVKTMSWDDFVVFITTIIRLNKLEMLRCTEVR
jgi:hypothetical protein